ncbi:IPT/TIG domain-containing protein [Pedobacter agri]|uniref:IPT/TIG domain-containing protein n=1 Tax=Pedobacter agri TaxID=454586 RepID=UPI00292E250A|nr:IPT/TIG domain-containing protein [Pedobacter agri]
MIYKNSIYGLLLVVLAMCFSQCAKKFEYEPTDNSAVIDSISPRRGTENTQVRIYGKNFPVDTAKIRALFNNKQGLIIEKSTNNVILATVPYEAGTGNVMLQINGQAINGPTFTYDFDSPVILEVLPLTGIAGTELTINGRKFSATAANNQVTINGVPANILRSSTVQLIAQVPEAKNGPVTVTSNSISNQGPVFKFIPQITSLDKGSGYVGDVIKIAGKYFDAGPNLSVTFNGVTAAVNSVNSTGIEVKVPASTSGNVMVTVDGVSSNTQPFTYKIAPTITGLSKTSAFAQDTLTVFGANFIGAAAPVVSFNGSAATVLSHSANQIKVRIPAGTNGNVLVTVDGIASNAVPFSYLQNIVASSLNQASPVLRNVSGIDGATVVIKGNSFGTQTNGIRVTVGSQNAQVVSVDDGNVTFLIPSFSSSQPNVQQIKIYRNNVEASYPNGNLTFTYLEPTILSSSCTITPSGILGFSMLTFVVSGNNYNATAANANFEMFIEGIKYPAVVNANVATITMTQPTGAIKNGYNIQVRNKWGAFISAFQRNITLSSFSRSFVNNTNWMTIVGDGFGNTAETARSVSIYRINNGVKETVNINSIISWSDDRIVVEFPNYIDDRTYGVEVKINLKTASKEQFLNLLPDVN